MDRWSHSVCIECWGKVAPDQEPHVLNNDRERSCCLCGEKTTSGIYVRVDPSKTLCKGVHPDDETRKLEKRPG